MVQPQTVDRILAFYTVNDSVIFLMTVSSLSTATEPEFKYEKLNRNINGFNEVFGGSIHDDKNNHTSFFFSSVFYISPLYVIAYCNSHNK